MQFKVSLDSANKGAVYSVGKGATSSHAMLLVGPPGNGKLGMALALHSTWCRDKTENDSAVSAVRA